MLAEKSASEALVDVVKVFLTRVQEVGCLFRAHRREQQQAQVKCEPMVAVKCEPNRQTGSRPTEMRGKGLQPDVISYSASVSACKKGQQLQQALQLPKT
jgi:hypothetical protein